MVFNYRKPTRRTYRRRNTYKQRNGKKPFMRNLEYKPSHTFALTRWARGREFLRSIDDTIDQWPIMPGGNYKVLWNQPQYTLTDLPDFTEFTKLFRYYQLNLIVHNLQFMWNGSQGALPVDKPATPLATWQPWSDWRAFSLIDKSHTRDWEDEGLIPPNLPQVSINAAKQFSSFRCHASAKQIRRNVHPKGLGVMDSNGSLLPATQDNAKWYVTSRPNQTFWGLVFGIQPTPAVQNLSNYWRVGYMMEMKFYMRFKGLQ